MKNGLARLRGIPLCRGAVLAKRAENFLYDSSSPEKRAEDS